MVVCCFRASRAPAGLGALQRREARIDAALIIVADSFDEAAEAAQRLGAAVCLRSRDLVHLGPAVDLGMRVRAERQARNDSQAFEYGQREILEQVASGRPLPEVLEQIVLLVERQGEKMLGTILLMDEDGVHVRHGAAPHMPRTFVEAINGSAIGPHEGSCGAAAYSREPVIVDDIGTHPNWVNYRHVALPWGLRACWSSPIFSMPGGEVLGTFALYYREARQPTEREQKWVAHATHLASIAILRDRSARAIRQADARYRQIVDTAYEGIWLVDGDARTMFVNHRAASMLGYEMQEMIGRRIVEFMDDASRSVAEGTFVQRLRTISDQREFRFQRKDGTYFWALMGGSAIRNEHGEVCGALGMITDITALKRSEDALRRSEAEFRVVFENAAIGMALLDGEGRITRSNPALRRFMDFSEAELHLVPFDSLVHPEDRDLEGDIVRDVVNGQRSSHQSERRYVRKDGAVVWGRLSTSVVQPTNGIPLSVIGMIENITDRRRAEDAVRSSERLRALMYGAVSDVLFYISVEAPNRYRFLSVNPAFLKATGLTESAVIGRTLGEVIPALSLGQVLANYGRAIQERRTITWDEITPYPSGKKYGEVTITPIFDDLGNCTNLVGTVHDVTERRIAAQRLADQATLLDRARDAILVRDFDGVIRYWNEGAQRLYGWTSAEAVGRRAPDFLYRRPASFDEAQRRLRESGAWSGEIEQVTKTGKNIVVEGRWTLITDEEKQSRSVLVINTDITERKSLEAQVFHAQRLESLGVLAGGIAHDFNNLLTAIIGNAQSAMLDLGRDHPARASVWDVERAGRRCADLVRQLLTFSRRQETRRDLVDVRPLVTETEALLRATLPKRVKLEVQLEEEVPNVIANATQMHQIVMNLGTNAVHAIGAADGIVHIRVERAVLDKELATRAHTLRPGTYARLVVADNGAGMDDSTMERIFDPFFTTKPTGQGTGLGLSVVHGIVRSHEGGILVRSTPGHGTELSVYLPEAS